MMLYWFTVISAVKIDNPKGNTWASRDTIPFPSLDSYHIGNQTHLVEWMIFECLTEG